MSDEKVSEKETSGEEEKPLDEQEPDQSEPAQAESEPKEADQKEPESEQPEAEHQAAEPEEVAEPPVAEEPAPVEIAPVAVVAAKPKGRVLAVFAFLFAIMAVAGVGYLYYELVYLKPLAQVQSQSSQIQAQYSGLQSQVDEQIKTLSASTSAAIETIRSEQAERLATNETAVRKSLNEALTAAPPSQREWKLAEAEYLLRIANHRVLMEQDSIGAMGLLQAADQIIEELDDFALYQVRALLADEIIALRQIPRDDLQGLYLRLEAVKSQLNNLPLPEPTYLRSEPQQSEAISVWQTLLDELKNFVRIRPLSGQEALKPLMAPEEARYLALNLHLAVEQAQLATLKRQQEVFEQSLLNVRRWLVEHTDTSDQRTTALLASVDELMLIELARPLPDISPSLNELLSIRRSGP